MQSDAVNFAFSAEFFTGIKGCGLSLSICISQKIVVCTACSISGIFQRFQHLIFHIPVRLAVKSVFHGNCKLYRISRLHGICFIAHIRRGKIAFHFFTVKSHLPSGCSLSVFCQNRNR